MGVDKITEYLPAAALVAIILFIARETVEFLRRRGADKRKLDAIKILLARECEFNHWTYKRCRDIVETIKDEMKKSREANFKIIFTRFGVEHFRVMRPDGTEGGGSSVAHVHSDVVDKQLLEVAVLDKDLFPKVERVHNALTTIEHVAEGIVTYIEEDREHLDGFPDYALRELDSAFKDLQALYLACTGKPLEKHRLR